MRGPGALTACTSWRRAWREPTHSRRRYNHAVPSSSPKLPEVELAPGTLVIADLHLDVGPSGGEAREFATFVEALRDVPRMIVLGDLFDAWVGPAQIELVAARRVVELMRGLTQRGTKLDVLVGNRDFLLEAKFEAATGARVHREGFVGLVGGQRVLFIHGDELCTLDRGYQRLKSVLRSPPMMWTAPRLPRAVALGIAKRLRSTSQRAVYAKPASEKEQQRAEVARLAVANSSSTLVCGHAHEFRDERLDPTAVRWIVLDAFGGTRDVLRVGEQGALELRGSRAGRA